MCNSNVYTDNRLSLITLPTPGEGWRTHLFVDGIFMCSVIGHDTDGGFIRRTWSGVEQAIVLFQGDPLYQVDITGIVKPEDFSVLYGEVFEKIPF